MSRDTDRPEDRKGLRQLGLADIAAAHRNEVAQVYVQQPRDGVLRDATFRYRPAHQYRLTTDQLPTQEIAADGGYDTLHDDAQRTTVFYWLNPETGAALYHTGVNDEETIPFFADESAARDYLEHRAAIRDTDRYNGLSLYRARTRKVADAVDVLTDQAGFEDFVPDGGQPITASEPGQVWFWYNPSLDAIVQEEIEPYDIRGVFSTQDDAEQFLDWYADQYGVVDTSHLELYRADLEREGFGRKHLDEASHRSEAPPEQVDFDAFRAAEDGTDGGDAV